jgi:uncharacterized protein (DUF433 family)
VTRAIEIGCLTDRDPAIRDVRPKIAGTSVTMTCIAACYRLGPFREEIATQYGHLRLAQVRAALASYCANPQEVEADLSEEEAFANGSSRKKGDQ